MPVGTIVHRVFDCLSVCLSEGGEPSKDGFGPVTDAEKPNWIAGATFRGFPVSQVIRYRIQKPRAQIIIEEAQRVAEGWPVLTPETEDA